MCILKFILSLLIKFQINALKVLVNRGRTSGSERKFREANFVFVNRIGVKCSILPHTHQIGICMNIRPPWVRVGHGFCILIVVLAGCSARAASLVAEKSNAGATVSTTLTAGVNDRGVSGSFLHQTSAACGRHCAICYGQQLNPPSISV